MGNFRPIGRTIDRCNGSSFDTAGNLYVSEFGNSRVQELDNIGSYLTKWGVFGIAEAKFNWPYGIAINNVGSIYVVNSRNDRVQVFSQPLPAAFKASIIWDYSWTNKRVTDENGFECTPAGNSKGTALIYQKGQYVNAKIEETSYSGFVSGATYNLSRAETIDAESIITEEIILTLTSATSGNGNSYTAVTDNSGSYCLGDGVFSLSKWVPDVSSVTGGSGGGGCFIETIFP